MHNPTYKYSDICLLPNRSDIGSRSSCLTYTTIGHNIFDLPIIPANMKTVIDGDIASKLENENLFYIMHRFGNDPIKFITEDMSADSIKSISVGVKEQDISTIERLEEGDCVIDYITIDGFHWMGQGKIKVIIDSVFTFENAVEAHKKMLAGKGLVGKIILKPN